MANLAKKVYYKPVKTVNIGELKNQLSGYLQYVKDGEEVVVKDRSVPIARILPFHHGLAWDQEAHLIASGAMKMPEDEGTIDWDEFFSLDAGDVPHGVAVAVLIDGRGDL